MANPLPQGSIPKLYRIKKAGKEIGSWQVIIKGKRVNLRTQDYLLARERAREAVTTGNTTFSDDSREQLALSPMPQAPTGNRFDSPPPLQSSGSDDWISNLANAAASIEGQPDAPQASPPQSEPVTPDGYAEPFEKADEPADAPTDDKTSIPPELFDSVLGQVAMGLVQGQLMLHQWLAKRWAKVELSEVPFTGESAASRKVGVAMWKEALKDLFPSDIPLPAYLAAPLMVFMMGLPVQLKGAKPIDPNAEPTQ